MGLHWHSDKSLYAREVNARSNAKKIRPGNASYIAGTVCLLTIAIRYFTITFATVSAARTM